MKLFGLFLIFVLLLFVMVSPFLPGEYDALAIPLSMVVQLCSSIGLLTCIPAIVWFYQGYRRRKAPGAATGKSGSYIKAYVWVSSPVWILIAFFVMLGVSKLLAIFLLISIVFLFILLIRKVPSLSSKNSFYLSFSLAILPILLFISQLFADTPLTHWSRERAISNSRQLIDDIERYKIRYGRYPRTLNALHKDYHTGVKGVEKYCYAYDDSTYNLYFEQPRFLFDQFGVREMVVYNPADEHQILSHASWHMHLTPEQARRTQGWFISYNTGNPHWRYFWFD